MTLTLTSSSSLRSRDLRRRECLRGTIGHRFRRTVADGGRGDAGGVDGMITHSGSATLDARGRGHERRGTLSGTAEVYDPDNCSWPVTAPDGRARGRWCHRPNRPLVRRAGDPESGTWSATGGMAGFRQQSRRGGDAGWHRAGGGGDNVPGGDNPIPLASAELYDLETGTWSTTGNMVEARIAPTATLLSDGTVPPMGGNGGPDSVLLTSAQLYDPTTGSWAASGGLIEDRIAHTATLLSDGTELVAGGSGFGTGQLASAELYDPTTDSGPPPGMINALLRSATLLPDGTVLAAGGSDLSGENISASAELYDPTTGLWTAGASMAAARSGYTARCWRMAPCLWRAGDSNGSLVSAELYDPGAGS